MKATQESNFSHWELNNHVIEDASLSEISLFLTDNDTITAVFSQQDEADMIVINEFLAANESIITDDEGDYEDWIELYYNIPSSMNLGGYYLTDDLNNPSKWMFPDLEISGEGYIFIWADDDEEEGPLHAGFNLSRSGEEIGFFDNNLNLIDQISFGPQSDDISYGRSLDGSSSWEFFNTPTPGNSNSGCQTGDMNCDGEVNVVDVILVVNFVMEDVYQYSADLNNDGNIDVMDIIQLVNIILN